LADAGFQLFSIVLTAKYAKIEQKETQEARDFSKPHLRLGFLLDFKVREPSFVSVHISAYFGYFAV
jgi:hypothetical protein